MMVTVFVIIQRSVFLLLPVLCAILPVVDLLA